MRSCSRECVSLSRRRLLAALAGVPVMAALAPARRSYADPEIAEGAQALVQSFAGEGVLLLEDRSAGAAERVQRFRSLLDKYFAVDAIAKWVLGRNWSQLTHEEHVEYRRLFQDLVVYGYVKRFGEYTGERLHIKGAAADSATQATVFSEIDRPAGGQPVRVDWRVGATKDGALRITDVVVENVSLSVTWRSDFSSVIQQSGSPSSLLETMRERIRQLKADLGA